MNTKLTNTTRHRMGACRIAALWIAGLLAACAAPQSLLFRDDRGFSMQPALVVSRGKCYLRFEFGDKPVRPVIASQKEGDDLVFRAHKFISAFPDTATIQYYVVNPELVCLTNRAFWQNPDGTREQLQIESDEVMPGALMPELPMMRKQEK